MRMEYAGNAQQMMIAIILTMIIVNAVTKLFMMREDA